ncbi:hypothetical protein MRX96_034970 [Rhipicephalus microplus]
MERALGTGQVNSGQNANDRASSGFSQTKRLSVHEFRELASTTLYTRSFRSTAIDFYGFKERGVYLTVSSYEGPRRMPGHFEVNWYGVDVDHLNRTFAALLSEAPNSHNWKNAQLYPVKQSTGRVTTRVKFPKNSTQLAMTGNCLDYWAVLLEVDDVSGDNNAAVVDSSCFRGHPRWMQENCCHFYNLKVDEMFIPGTHDSAMYGLKRDWPVGDFIFTQDQTITHQLAFGIRSLDLRVGFTDGAFWIFHNKFKAQVSLETVLRQVRTFVETTGEVVILDFHRFTLGFNRHVDPVEERHRMLVQLIMDTLPAAVAHRRLFNSTLEDLLGGCGARSRWRRPTVFIMYNYDYMGPNSEFLCPGVIQNWANAQDLDYLVEYLEKNACKKFPGTLSSAQAELTAKFPSQMDTIRQLAEIVNFNVTNLFREHFWNCTNIVTNDYFLGSGTVELAIEANKYRGKLKGGLGRCEHGLQRGLSTNRL